jgi:tetratricopeptide (TPR) repeat protein
MKALSNKISEAKAAQIIVIELIKQSVALGTMMCGLRVLFPAEKAERLINLMKRTTGRLSHSNIFGPDLVAEIESHPIINTGIAKLSEANFDLVSEIERHTDFCTAASTADSDVIRAISATILENWRDKMDEGDEAETSVTSLLDIFLADMTAWRWKRLSDKFDVRVDCPVEVEVPADVVRPWLSFPPNWSAEAYFGRIEDLISGGERAEAKQTLESLVAHMPSNWTVCEETDNAYIRAFWNEEELAAYRSYAERNGFGKSITNVPPPYPRAYSCLAYLATEDDAFEEALEFLNIALTLEPDNTNLMCQKALVLNLCGKHEQAVAQYEQAVNCRTWSPAWKIATALRGQAIALVQLGRFDEAETALLCSLTHQPKANGDADAKEQIEYVEEAVRTGRERQAGPNDAGDARGG